MEITYTKYGDYYLPDIVLSDNTHYHIGKYGRMRRTFLIKQGKIIMSSTDETKFLFRVFAVNMVLAGSSAATVADLAGVTKATVTNWVRTVDEKGFDALRALKQSGRPSKLSESQLQSIDAALQSAPSDYGFKIWDGPSLSSYIFETFKVQLSTRQCQRLFHELGYSHIRPQPYPSKGYEDTAERESFKKNALK